MTKFFNTRISEPLGVRVIKQQMWRTAPSPEISKLLILRNEQLDLAIECLSVSHPDDQLILIWYGFELSKRYRIDNWHQIITHITSHAKKNFIYIGIGLTLPLTQCKSLMKIQPTYRLTPLQEEYLALGIGISGQIDTIKYLLTVTLGKKSVIERLAEGICSSGHLENAQFLSEAYPQQKNWMLFFALQAGQKNLVQFLQQAQPRAHRISKQKHHDGELSDITMTSDFEMSDSTLNLHFEENDSLEINKAHKTIN